MKVHELDLSKLGRAQRQVLCFMNDTSEKIVNGALLHREGVWERGKSRIFNSLFVLGLIECLNPSMRTNRVWRITKKGKKLVCKFISEHRERYNSIIEMRAYHKDLYKKFHIE